MARTGRRTTGVLAAVTGGTVGVVLVIVPLWVPNSQVSSGYIEVGTTLYAYESVNAGAAPALNVSFHGVLFEFPPAACAQSTGGGNICGTVVESDEVTYSFDVPLPPSGPAPGPWVTWIAPDGHEAIELAPDLGDLTRVLVAS
jgi:hypothetical protein